MITRPPRTALPPVCIEWQRRWGGGNVADNSPSDADGESHPVAIPDLVRWVFRIVDRIVRELAPAVLVHYQEPSLAAALQALPEIRDAASSDAAIPLLKQSLESVGRSGRPYWMFGSMRFAVEAAAALAVAEDEEARNDWLLCLFDISAALDMSGTRSFGALTEARVAAFFQSLVKIPRDS